MQQSTRIVGHWYLFNKLQKIIPWHQKYATVLCASHRGVFKLVIGADVLVSGVAVATASAAIATGGAGDLIEQIFELFPLGQRKRLRNRRDRWHPFFQIAEQIGLLHVCEVFCLHQRSTLARSNTRDRSSAWGRVAPCVAGAAPYGRNRRPSSR
jgi:hypothetical protein